MNLYNSKNISYLSNSKYKNIFSQFLNTKQNFKELNFGFSNKKTKIKNLCFNLKKAAFNYPINEQILKQFKNSIDNSYENKIPQNLFHKKFKKKCNSVSSISTNISNNLNLNLISNSYKSKRNSSIYNVEPPTIIKKYSDKPQINKKLENLKINTKKPISKNISYILY